MASFFIAGRLYFNSLLAALNLRVSSAPGAGAGAGAGSTTGDTGTTLSVQGRSVPAPWAPAPGAHALELSAVRAIRVCVCGACS
jgi:hypothetical protein